MNFGELIQSADWKNEKHVPAIDTQEVVPVGQPFMVTVSVGKEIPHPNTVEHHISWIDLYFMPDGGKFVHQVAHFELNAHGASAKGANEGPVHSHPVVSFLMTLEVSGTLIAVEHCNIHGLWENSLEIQVE